MKAIAVFPGTRELKIIDHPEPAIESPTQVKLRILEVGVCGTDPGKICQFDYGTPPAGSEYLILGHESLGEVVEVGSGVASLKPGDLVVTMVRRPCDHPECFACRSGRQDFCYTGDFKERGINQLHGFMTEFVVDDVKYMNPAPASLRDVAVLTEPLTIAEKAVSEVWQIQQRLPWGLPTASGGVAGYKHRAVVLGAGPVGLLGAMTLLIAGFETYVYSRGSKTQSDFVASIGGIYVESEGCTIPQLAEKVGNIDLVYEATGASKFAFDTLAALGTNGVFIFTGVPGRKGPIEIDTDTIMRNLVLKNQVVYGSVNAGQSSYASAIEDLAKFKERWPNAAASLITGHYAMENFKDLLLGQPSGIKNVITISK